MKAKILKDIYKIVLICSISMSFKDCIGQNLNKESDSLEKYCYRVFVLGSDAVPISTGTGFFYKRKEMLYFITANHVIAGCVVENNVVIKGTPLPNSIQITGDNNGKNFVFMWLDIKILGEQLPCKNPSEYPDIAVLPIPKDDAQRDWNKVYSVESFGSSNMTNNGDVKVVGYPSDSNFVKGHLNVSRESGTLSWHDNQYKVDKADSINHYLLDLNKDIPCTSCLFGYSGSPVFFKEKKSNQWMLSGIFSGINTLRGLRYMIVPKISFNP